MHRYLSQYLVAAFALAFVVGCGTIIHGSTQQVSVASNPSGAQVEIDGLNKGTTPVTAELSRKDQHTVKLDLDGYEPYELIVNRKVSGWVAGNIIFGGLIGLAVDAISGGMYKLDPAEVQAALDQPTAARADNTDRIFITVVMQPDPDWEKIGTLAPRP